MVLFQNVKKEDIQKLVQKGFAKEKLSTVYEEARLTKNGITAVLYTSGKLLLQGKPEQVNQAAEQVRKLRIGEEAKGDKFRKETGWVIGSDEALKGDTFGGIVVAGVKADDTARKKLLELGVQDSKKLSDKEIPLMAEKIKQISLCEVRNLLPEEYNQYKGGVTDLLNKLHLECADYLKPGTHVVDKYPGCSVGDLAEEKAESKFIEVAAASVLARAAALKQLDMLSAQAGFAIPKGSTHVNLALHELQERKLSFGLFVKIDFANVKTFLECV